MPFDIDRYPTLKSILGEAYQNTITYRNQVDGAHDTNWIKEYELFYNTQPNSTPHVKRIFLKGNIARGKKAGFVDIRPISDASRISEVYLTPPKFLSAKQGAYVTCLSRYNDYGEKVNCVPFIMPDSIFGMCIHASIWICLKILENRRMIEKSLTIPEIQTLVSGRPYSDRQGLPFVQATRLLRMCKTSAFYIINKERPYLTDEQMLMELYAYVESGLPVILGVDTADLEWWHTRRHGYHSIVAIGHTMKDNEIDGFIFHDESALPYQVLKTSELLNAWHLKGQRNPSNYIRELLVAVPPLVSLQFTEAYQQFEETLSTLRDKSIISKETESYQIRPILTSSATVFFETGRNPLLFFALREANFPEHIWTFHLFDQKDNRIDLEKSKGFFIRDATRRTEFRFVYLKELKKAIYQLEEGKTYERGLNKKGVPKKRRRKL